MDNVWNIFDNVVIDDFDNGIENVSALVKTVRDVDDNVWLVYSIDTESWSEADWHEEYDCKRMIRPSPCVSQDASRVLK